MFFDEAAAQPILTIVIAGHEAIHIAIFQDIWCQQGGIQAHFVVTVRRFLDDILANRGIAGR